MRTENRFSPNLSLPSYKLFPGRRLTVCLIGLSALGGLAFQDSFAKSDVSPAETGWYLSASGGPQWRDEACDTAGCTRFDTGFTLNGALGYRLDPVRIEGEFTYMNNQIKSVDPAGPLLGRESGSGNADVYGLFVNVHYDFPIERFTPFVGGGIGVNKISINGLTNPSLRTLPAESGGPVVVNADSDWAFAYQLRVGVSYPLMPRTKAWIDYRYLHGNQLDVNQQDGQIIHPDVVTNGVEFGLRMEF